MTERTLVDERTAEIDATFDLLSNARRRGVLYAVNNDGAVTVDDLAARIAAWQSGGEVRRDDANGRRSDAGAPGVDAPSVADVRTSLIHSHLPRLDDANVVDYDPEAETVELANGATVDPYLRVTGESAPSLLGTDSASETAD